MKKQLLLSLFTTLFLVNATYAQYYLSDLGSGSNPRGLNTENENPSALLNGWTTIWTGNGNSLAAFSPSTQLPFTFNFNGNSYDYFKASNSGSVTFDTSSTILPAYGNHALPSSLVPGKSVNVLGVRPSSWVSGSTTYNSAIITKTFGNAPNRQFWIQYNFFSEPNISNGWTYWAIVLEETTNKIFIVDMKTLCTSATGICGNNVKISAGIQINVNSAFSIVGSPNLGANNFQINLFDASDNKYYEFANGIQPNIWMKSISKQTSETASTSNSSGTPISVRYVNFGALSFSSANLKYTVNNGATVTQAIIQSIPSNGGVGTISTSLATNYRPSVSDEGTFKTIRVWLSNINGTNNNSDTIQFNVFVNRGIKGNKKLLMEVFEGAWVGHIPDGRLYLDSIKDIFGDSVIIVSHHNGDGMSNNSSDEIQTAFTQSFPSAAIDRVNFPGSTNVAVSRNLWKNYASSQLATNTPANISIINKTFNPTTRVIEYDIKIDFVDYPTPGNFKLNTFIVEDGVRGPMISGTNTTWNQRNLYGASVNHPFYNYPQYIVGYKHDNVVRNILSGAWGGSYLIPKNPQIGSSYTQHFSYVLPSTDSVTQTGFIGQNDISNIYQNTHAGPAKNKQENIRVVAFLSYDSTDVTMRKVINTAQVQLIDNVNYLSDTLICKGKTVTFNMGPHKLYLGSTYLGNTIVNLSIDSTTTFAVKNLMGNTIKTIKVTVVDSLSIQSIFANDTINICGYSNKFILGSTTSHTGPKTYKWYRNDSLLTNISRIDSFVNSGVYRTVVTTSTGCSQNKLFYVTKINSSFNPDFTTNRQIATAPPFDFTFANQTQPLNDYNYFWKWGDGITDSTNNQILFKTYSNNGQYTVKLIAQHKITGCKDSITKVNYINCSGLNPQPLAATTTKQNPYCAGEATGSITVNGTGGTLPYTYRINGGSYQSSNSFSGLVAGIYTLDIKDAINNVVTKKDTLVNPPAVSVGVINGSNNVPVNSIQSYSIVAQSGANYFWSVINGTLLSGNGTTTIQVQWPAGTGIGKIIASVNKGNCGATDTLTVAISPQPLGITSTKQNPFCAGDATGSITVNGSGGTAPYLYRINGGTYQTNNTFNNLAAGIYDVDVKDAINNTVTKKDTLTNPPAIAVGGINGLNGVPVSSTQTYSIVAQSGANYFWNVINGTLLSGNGTTSIQVQWPAVSGIGKIIAAVSKGNCGAVDTLTVAIGGTPLSITTSKINESCTGSANGSITVSAAGGNPPYTYAINNAAYQSSNTYSNLVAGIYLVKVKDNSQLIAQRYDTITAGSKPAVGIITGPITAATLSLQNYIVGQQANVTYLWSAAGGVIASGQNTNIAQIAWGAQPILAKVNVKITSNSGCSDSSSLDVNVGGVGLNDILLNHYTLSPNPTQNTLTIATKNGTILQGNVIITDMLGRKVKEVALNLASSNAIIDVSELVNGMYTLSVEDKNTISHANFIKK